MHDGILNLFFIKWKNTQMLKQILKIFKLSKNKWICGSSYEFHAEIMVR